MAITLLQTKNLIGIYCILLICACDFKKPEYTLSESPEDGVVLKNWRVVGPFRTTELSGTEIDYLKTFGKTEDGILYEELRDIPVVDSVFNFQYNDSVAIGNLTVDLNKISNLKVPKSAHAVAYAGCSIQSETDQNLKLNFSSTGPVKIWLNNKLLFSKKIGAFNVKPYEDYIDVPIKRGKNFLLTKLNKTGEHWEMFASLEKSSKENLFRYRKNFELEFGNSFLTRNIIENDTLKLARIIPDENLKLEIEGTRIAVSNIRANQVVDIRNLPSGFFKTKLIAAGDTFSSRFYKVQNYDKEYNKLTRSIKGLLKGKKNPVFDALVYRYNLLMKAENRPKHDYERLNWDKRMLFVFENLLLQYKILKHTIKEEDATGSILKSYKSKIDGGIQYYVVHVPSNYTKGKPLPLVIEMAKLMKWFPSPLETNRFANIKLIEQFNDLANKYNMFIIEPGNRTVDMPNYNGIDQADLWENLDNVKSVFNIDTTRLFLRGACRSSYDALKLAVRYPDKFSAVATVAPELKSRSSKNNKRAYQNNPLNFLGNIKDIPFYNIHSVIDKHSPIKASEDLLLFSKKAGLKKFYYKKLPREFKQYYSEEYLDEIFAFFSRIKPRTQPNEIHYSTNALNYNSSFWLTINSIQAGETASIDAHVKNNELKIQQTNILRFTLDLEKIPTEKKEGLTIFLNGKKQHFDEVKQGKITITLKDFHDNGNLKNKNIEGPFARIFGSSFIVVPGSSGSERDKDAIQKVVTTLNDDWKRRYFKSFIIKSDKEISKSDILNSNLILVGNPKSNLFLNKISDKLPIQINKDGININKQNIDGQDLTYYFIYPNPYNRSKYIGIIGYTNPDSFGLLSETNSRDEFDNVSNFGWYDYKIWDWSGHIIKGNFNYQWQ